MFDSVARILLGNRDLADVGEPQTSAAIKRAEDALGVKFPPSFREYLSKWGWVSFGPNEYFGLGAEFNNVVRRTKEARDRNALPHCMIVICDREGDEYVCIDTSRCWNADCEVIVWDIPAKSPSRGRSNSFEDFLTSDMEDFLA
ncbi:SMI1/KNR4 family protein [Caulobacter sp. 17J65-9]|uniref:SMI1/KNR4 family protein n=1 Tax=Caulobacter sp. 17J65-9 TaxID=2709382 RepID=UPI0013CD788A|nr:SMI1/KNR4 family protein [Caulobacter sp. 17J65-9]NEX93805.1 SMI1/KNR4 family protein [Caulobacter sp. 17J65-9]